MSHSVLFPVANDTKQDCVFAPTIICTVISVMSVMLMEVFNELDKGVYLHFRTDGKLLNIKILKAHTKVKEIRGQGDSYMLTIALWLPTLLMKLKPS